MSEDVWNKKKIDFSTKTSLITCVAYCTSWSGTGSAKNCNAVSYDKGIEIKAITTNVLKIDCKLFGCSLICGKVR